MESFKEYYYEYFDEYLTESELQILNENLSSAFKKSKRLKKWVNNVIQKAKGSGEEISQKFIDNIKKLNKLVLEIEQLEKDVESKKIKRKEFKKKVKDLEEENKELLKFFKKDTVKNVLKSIGAPALSIGALTLIGGPLGLAASMTGGTLLSKVDSTTDIENLS